MKMPQRIITKVPKVFSIVHEDDEAVFIGFSCLMLAGVVIGIMMYALR